MGELKVLNTSHIKYPYGVVFKIKTVGKVFKESFFGRVKKVKKACHKKGELFQGNCKIMEFKKFHSFKLDVFRLDNKYFLLSKIDNLFGVYDISSSKFTNLSLNPEQFKTNGEDKLILIINKEILYFKIYLIKDSIKLATVDRLSDFKTKKGVWLDINWDSNLSFDTMLVDCEDKQVSRNEYEKYRRMILKVRLDDDKITYTKSFIEPKN